MRAREPVTYRLQGSPRLKDAVDQGGSRGAFAYVPRDLQSGWATLLDVLSGRTVRRLQSAAVRNSVSGVRCEAQCIYGTIAVGSNRRGESAPAVSRARSRTVVSVARGHHDRSGRERRNCCHEKNQHTSHLNLPGLLHSLVPVPDRSMHCERPNSTSRTQAEAVRGDRDRLLCQEAISLIASNRSHRVGRIGDTEFT